MDVDSQPELFINILNSLYRLKNIEMCIYIDVSTSQKHGFSPLQLPSQSDRQKFLTPCIRTNSNA